MSISKSLLLTTCTWEDEKYESFQMIPVTGDCPYVEVIYDPLCKVLVLFAKDKRQHYAVLERMNEFGEPVYKDKKPLVERLKVESYKEFVINKPEEIQQFIELLALNAGHFDYNKYLTTLIQLPRSTTLKKA